MKESTKEWLGIKPADFLLYAAFLLLIPAYYASNLFIDAFFLLLGLLLCIVSCWLGMKPHPELGRVNNAIKFFAYPVSTLIFLCVAYFSYVSW